MERHFNDLTPAEAERLSLLLEECGEVIQVIGKIQRHGYESTNPLLERDSTNRQKLEREVADLLVAIEMLISADDIVPSEIEHHKHDKRAKLPRWLHHQEDPFGMGDSAP